MSVALKVEREPVSPMQSWICDACGIDAAEPEAVGINFSVPGLDTYLAVRCEICGLVYLDPRPAHTISDRLSEMRHGRYRKFLGRILARINRGARIGVMTEYNSAVRCDLAELEFVNVVTYEEESAGYDIVLAVDMLERSADSRETVSTIRKTLRPGGRIIIITTNGDSFNRTLFRGRHWAGYNFPQHTVIHNVSSLQMLTSKLHVDHAVRIRHTASLGRGSYWVRSIRNMMVDYNAPTWMQSLFDERSPVNAPFSVLDNILAIFGRGNMLVVVLEKV